MLERTRLLIIDDWGPEPLTAEQRRDLLEIVEDGIVTLTFVRRPEVRDELLRTSRCVSGARVLLPDIECLGPERAICRGRQ
jgi:hypothetical protein